MPWLPPWQGGQSIEKDLEEAGIVTPGRPSANTVRHADRAMLWIVGAATILALIGALVYLTR